MSDPIKSPTFVIGSPRSSGDTFTGEIPVTRGGQRVYSSLSGVAVDTLVVSGAGRLNTVIPYTRTSGHVIFYDSAVATSGGPFALSGHKILGYVGDNTTAISGVAQRLLATPFQFDTPFFSGLVAAPVGSGGPSFTATYSVERSATFPNP